MFKKPWGLLSKSTSLSYFKLIKYNHQWITPEGIDTGIKVYSRIENKKVPLIIKNKNYVKWYLCGPTVYDVSHIGHASCYVRFDIINRILREFFDINSVIAIGVTDIDDKIIQKAYYENVDFKSWAKKHELDFFEEIHKLNILPYSFILRVSDHIPEIISFVDKIIKNKRGYTAEDGSVYFDHESIKDKCTLHPLTETQGKVKLKEGQKSDIDFALWKGAKEGEPSWETPWGHGRPGWHIECSAMASKVFGSQLDFHGGGIDLLFPHHQNEELQSCCYHDCKQWVNYWLHTGELMVQEEKMSKSLKNFTPISSFLQEYTADQFRMFCFLSSYKKGLHYGSDAMELAVSSCNLITTFLGVCNSYVKGDWIRGNNISEASVLEELSEIDVKIKEYLKDDFDTGKCYHTLIQFLQKYNRLLNEETNMTSSRCPAAIAAVALYIGKIFNSFGFQFGALRLKASGDQEKLNFVVDQAMKFRSEVRDIALKCSEKQVKQKLLQSTDSIRSELKTFGVDIKDLANHTASWTQVDVKKEKKETKAKV